MSTQTPHAHPANLNLRDLLTHYNIQSVKL